MASLFNFYPNRPGNAILTNAHIVLTSAHDASSSFLDIFQSTRTGRNARGAATDEEQDLLRAMLVFSASGLDSMIKHMIRDALPVLIHNRDQGVVEMFKTFLERELKKNEPINFGFITDLLVDPEPKIFMIDSLIYELTTASLQSVDQILKVAAFFDIRSASIVPDPDGLRSIFKMRNLINHEMDIDFDQTNRNRIPRGKAVMIRATNSIFEVANRFLEEVDTKL